MTREKFCDEVKRRVVAALDGMPSEEEVMAAEDTEEDAEEARHQLRLSCDNLFASLGQAVYAEMRPDAAMHFADPGEQMAILAILDTLDRCAAGVPMAEG